MNSFKQFTHRSTHSSHRIHILLFFSIVFCFLPNFLFSSLLLSSPSIPVINSISGSVDFTVQCSTNSSISLLIQPACNIDSIQQPSCSAPNAIQIINGQSTTNQTSLPFQTQQQNCKENQNCNISIVGLEIYTIYEIWILLQDEQNNQEIHFTQCQTGKQTINDSSHYTMFETTFFFFYNFHHNIETSLLLCFCFVLSLIISFFCVLIFNFFI